MTKPEYRTISPSTLLKLTEPTTKPLRLRGFRDLLPSGHLFARMPVLVDWQRSDLSAEEPTALLRAVNAGGNPLDRTVVLNSARVPINRVAYAEVIFVPLDTIGVYQHGQIRFVFDKEFPIRLTTLADPITGGDVEAEDLVVSWEVWRYRDDGFNPIRSLDEANPLTMRAYTGPQRFLEDSLQGHEWRAYRMQLPGGRKGASELLKVALSLGDGIARHAVAGMMNRLEEGWGDDAPDGEMPDADTMAAWRKLRELAATDASGDPEEEPLGADSSTYNPLVRSCVAMMRYSVLLAAQRMSRTDVGDEEMRSRIPAPSLGSSEPWMMEASHCDLLGLFARAPLALDYLLRNLHAVPTKILEELDSAGLIAHKNGRADLMTYAASKTLPYGSDGVKRREG